ncbi:hypothetical protein LTS12_026950 [Elasticomyces elasticus]|nr:hypothetical protein LTS12_026950 [Elasticomyces elasticus]
MNQSYLDPEIAKSDLETLHTKLSVERFKDITGFLYTAPTKGVMDDPPEVRNAILEEAWQRGGFRLLFAYNNIMLDLEANDELYKFWAKKVRAQISDPFKRELLAPELPAHPFAGKRPSLEQDYYTQMDKDHVTLVDMRNNDISHFTAKGIVTNDGREHEVDIIALATGFDSVTGGLKSIDIRGIDGLRLAEKWRTGTFTYLGLTVADFPNLMFTYGPQSPTAYANGPSIVEKQGEWILSVMKMMNVKGKTFLNAKLPAEKEWKRTVGDVHAEDLRHSVASWYTGANIPGKPREALNYAGGLPKYCEIIERVLVEDMEGFTVE